MKASLWQVLLTVALFSIKNQQSSDPHMQKQNCCQKQMKTKKTYGDSFHSQIGHSTLRTASFSHKEKSDLWGMPLDFVIAGDRHRMFEPCDLEYDKVWLYVTLVLVWWYWRSSMSSFCVFLCVGVCVCVFNVSSYRCVCVVWAGRVLYSWGILRLMRGPRASFSLM